MAKAHLPDQGMVSIRLRTAGNSRTPFGRADFGTTSEERGPVMSTDKAKSDHETGEHDFTRKHPEMRTARRAPIHQAHKRQPIGFYNEFDVANVRRSRFLWQMRVAPQELQNRLELCFALSTPVHFQRKISPAQELCHMNHDRSRSLLTRRAAPSTAKDGQSL